MPDTPTPETPVHYVLYYPLVDSVNNMGFYQPVDDFKPGAFGGDPAEDRAEFQRATAHLPTRVEDVELSPKETEPAVFLTVAAEAGGGITWARLREAADAVRRGPLQSLDPLPEGREWIADAWPPLAEAVQRLWDAAQGGAPALGVAVARLRQAAECIEANAGASGRLEKGS